MSSRKSAAPDPAFEDVTLRIAMTDISTLRVVRPEVRKSSKYGQIASSIEEVGIIEPPVVARDPLRAGRFRLLDGHLRLDILSSRGDTEVVCLVATEDEAFTYNRRVNRVATIQEHRMILEAVARGVSEERLARALNLNITSIRKKRNLLVGICPEVAEMLKDRQVAINAFGELRKLKPMRQIRAAEMMVAMNRYSMGYVRSIVAASPSSELVEHKPAAPRALTSEQVDLMQQESARLDREFRLVEQTYGADHLDLVVAIAYIAALLENAKVVRHLAQYHGDLLSEFHKLATLRAAA